MTIDHDRCSELIAPFVRGELTERAAAEVREHLDGCDACSAEERGARALLDAGTEPSMSELERVRLHRRLEDAVGAERGREVQAAPRRRGAGARIAALGAAAVLAALGGFLYLGLSGGGAGQGVGGEAGDLGSARGDDEGAAAESGAGQGGAVAPEPTFIDRLDRLTDRELESTGRRGSAVSRIASAYQVDDVGETQSNSVATLAGQAPVALREQIRRCAEVVFEGQPQSLPASGRRGAYQGRTVLVLTFAWSDDPAGPLDRFMVWVWPEGGSCDTPVAYRFGTIKTGA
jgi:Putative zinc-finger